jgi:ribose transport system ATP-binding protein
MQGITKRFPGVLALDKVDFQLKPGEVHVLLGENGAGKSTLIKVLSGAHLADEGRIQIEGQAVGISSPHFMLEKGMRFIYQEQNLVQEIDIARNMFLGMEPINGITHDLRPGTCAVVESGECHELENIDGEDLVLIHFGIII